MSTKKEPARRRVEYYVHKVKDYSSRYNHIGSFHYAPCNLVGKYELYPTYGDFPECYCLKNYGSWWKQSRTYQPNYRPQDFDCLGAEDYITVEFEEALVPSDICIYEIFNPGAVVRIRGKLSTESNSKWILLWEGAPEKIPPISRKFHKKIKNIDSLINTLRIEFNPTHLEYHYAVEAVLMGGFQARSMLEAKILGIGLLNIIGSFSSKLTCQDPEESTTASTSDCSTPSCSLPEVKPMLLEDTCTDTRTDYFLNLPNEIILQIFQYLDLISLSHCSMVNRRWNDISRDALLYQNINLRPYWHLVNVNTILYYRSRCQLLKKVDVSWCGNDVPHFSTTLEGFLASNAHSITHLSLSSCKFLNENMFQVISLCSELVDLCQKLQRLDEIVQTAVEHNKKLSAWSCWKSCSITPEGVRRLGRCPNLKEIDLGWCLNYKDPGDSLHVVAKGCPKLERLILSAWRGLNDALLAPIIKSCKELKYLDLLGSRNITGHICEKALRLLPKLELLDLCYSFCITQNEVNLWRRQYPNVTIQFFPFDHPNQ
ncbi:F-box/LRR-repeat protein 4 isoform X2 [Diabrotica virgifera virgifera]|uniref:F-box/LRR-repeat protein 4-like isoform X2 n=1 Tax=Diabrotica virgifera virgifera TaxID=50390 RepID=A0A6P7F4B6_DIAVI|nr:F-box/LRR-repeat protein 4 isoform X2 [Diabrotica virgifera virgifera]